MNSVAPPHQEFRHQTSRLLAAAPQRRDGRGNPLIRPEFAFTRNGYHLRVVPAHGSLRSAVDQLIQRMYAGRGLNTYSSPPPSTGFHSQTSLVACKGDHPFGTLTVGVDTGQGLLADTLYRPQIDAARKQGARVCEVTRLAMDPELSNPEAMAAIFHLGFIIARLVHGMTDSFIEVHPRHTGYYRRTLGYRVAGPHLTCPRVGAPAVLMHLPLAHAEQQALRYGGTGHARSRNLYQLFLSPMEQKHLVRTLGPCT